jgi:hypothetical protein
MRDEDETERESADLERRTGDVEPKVRAAADRLPDEQGGVFAAEYKSHSGPLPSQDWLTAVEALHPGATEMVLQDFTDERSHQRQMQTKALELDAVVVKDFTHYQMARLLIAGGLALFVAAAGIALILLDKGVYGFVLLIAELAGLVGVFLYGRRSEADQDFDVDELIAELEDGEGND